MYLLTYLLLLTIVYIMHLAGDVGPQSCTLVAKSSKIGPQFFGKASGEFMFIL